MPDVLFRKAVPFILVPFLVSGASAAAFGQRSAPHHPGPRTLDSQLNSRIMLHITPGQLGADSAATCAAVEPLPCRTGQSSFTTEVPLSTPENPYYFAYVIVANYEPAPGFRGVQFGIDYDGDPLSGVDILDWTSCSVLEFPTDNWPQPGSGNLQTWFCTTRGFTVAGYFTLSAFSPDVLDLGERPVDQALKVADCDGAETLLQPVAAGAAGFGGRAGEDPCFSLGDLPPLPPPPAPPEARIMLHAVPTRDVAGDRCSSLIDLPCSRGVRTFTTEVPLTTPENPEYLVYVLIKHPYADRGVHRAGFPLGYDPGIIVHEWTSCASIQESWRQFPASGGSVNLTWFPSAGGCTPRPMTVAGYFRVEARSPGALRLRNQVEWERGGLVYCTGPNQDLIYNDFVEFSEMGSIGFGGSPGSDPCFDGGWEELAGRLVPVQETTWGAIKTLYR